MTAAINYENLFAKNAPEPQPIGAIKRAKYDFAVAYPDPGSLPLDDLVESLAEAIAEEGRDLAVYPHPAGYPPLREFVSQKLARDRKIDVSPDDIILADGSSQPIHMVLEALLDPGDVVITEHFAYSGTLRALHRFQADVRGVASDDDGVLPDALEGAIRAAIDEGRPPKLIYTIPTFQNPQGWTMSLDRRREMLRISGAYGVPILEDDCYVDLRFEGENVQAIQSLDDEGRVTYVGSFSKIIAPGMRMGYVAGPIEVLDQARAVKSGAGVNQFAALAVHRYATTHLDDHVAEVNGVLRSKRDAMLAALGENFGSAASWSRPDGGLYVWLRLPDHADLAAALPAAFDADVGYQPGNIFSPDGESGRNYARLCYGYNTPEEIYEGIARLAEVFEREGALTS